MSKLGLYLYFHLQTACKMVVNYFTRDFLSSNSKKDQFCERYGNTVI